MKLIVCPLKIELKAIKQSLVASGFKLEEFDFNGLLAFKIQSLKLILIEGGHGKVQYGISVQKALSDLGPFDWVLSVGSAGALNNKLKPQDLVLANCIVEHDFKEKFNTKQKLPKIQTDPHLLELFSNLHFPDTIIGGIASGDEDINDDYRKNEILKQTEAAAVAWESMGAAKACRFNKVPFIEVRAITDLATGDVKEVFLKNLNLASNRLADFIIKANSI